MSTDTVADLMALADAYGYACHECRGSPEGSPETDATRTALEQSIRRAVDWKTTPPPMVLDPDGPELSPLAYREGWNACREFVLRRQRAIERSTKP